MPCYVMCMFCFNPDSNRDCSIKEFKFCFFCSTVISEILTRSDIESILKKAIHLSKNNPRAYHNLGVVYEKAIRPLQALFCYERAIELNYPRKEELAIRVEKIKQFLAENQ